MPCGPAENNPGHVQAGTLELLGQKAIVPRDNEIKLAEEQIISEHIWGQDETVDWRMLLSSLSLNKTVFKIHTFLVD